MKPATYCKNCGAYIPDGKKKCLACGFPVDMPSLGGDINKVETTTFQECSPNRLSFKPFYNYTPDGRYFWNGYEINEKGQVLSIPDDDEIPMTTFTDDTIQVIKGEGKVKIKPELGIVEVARNSSFEMWKAKFEEQNQKSKEPKPDIDLIAHSTKLSELESAKQRYDSILQLTDYLLQNTKQLKPKQQEPKPDIDLDDLMEKTFFTVKIDGKVSRFYFGDRPIIRVDDLRTLCHTQIDGRIVIDTIKRIIDFRLLEG